MQRINNFFKDWKLSEKLWLGFVLFVQTIAWVMQKEDIFMLIMTITSSLNLVFGAKGKIAGLYFAIINSVLYAINCYNLSLYGEVMYHVLYSIPVSAIAIYTWSKNQSQNGEVEFRNMSLKMIVISFGGTLLGVYLYMLLLKALGGYLPFMDSLTTVVGVVASMLYLFRYSEQWAMWAIVNALAIVMWIMVYQGGDDSALLIILMNIINLLNAVYGLVNWRRIAHRYGNQ